MWAAEGPIVAQVSSGRCPEVSRPRGAARHPGIAYGSSVGSEEPVLRLRPTGLRAGAGNDVAGQGGCCSRSPTH